MESTQMYVISENYFTLSFSMSLSKTISSNIESDCYIEFEGISASLKDAVELLKVCEIIPGKKVKISCFNNDYKSALRDINKVRKLIECDFTGTVK